MQMFLCQDRQFCPIIILILIAPHFSPPAYFSSSGMVRVLEKVPEVSLSGGAGPAAEVFLLLSLLLGLGQEPPGPVVSVLAARLHVEVVQSPVLQLLAEVLNTNLDNGGERRGQTDSIALDCTYSSRKMELSISVQSQNGIKVPRWSIEEIFLVVQGVGITDVTEAWG